MYSHINKSWSIINFNDCRICALKYEGYFMPKPQKTEVEYDVVQDIGEW